MKTILTQTWQFLTVTLLCIGMIVSPACTLSQQLGVVTDIQKFIPAISNVADAVCSLDSTSSICAGGVQSVTASANILITALDNYYTAKAAGVVPASVISDLQTAITTFENNAANILNAVHVLNPALQQKIELIAAAAQVLLAVVETLLPTVVSAKKFATSRPVNFDLDNWVVDYNSKVNAVQQSLPKTVTLKKVHVHSTFLRVVSFGKLK